MRRTGFGGGVVVLALVGATITPVSGPSQLEHLHLALADTSMGLTGQWGPRPDRFDPRLDPTAGLYRSNADVTLTGEDLYRLDCRGCHKADGHGAPPEINTLVDPVQGTSLVLWERRMAELGRPVDPAFARQVVEGSRADLLKRLVHGGEKMPPFEFLSDAEVQALVGYLDVLVGVPGARPPRTVTVPSIRVGEHLVKGTCHICHAATGSWPDPEALLEGAVPPLGAITDRLTLGEVIRKVRHGAPVEMGFARVLDRGRMPVFDYLTDEEVADAYFYLTLYPPTP